MHMHYWAIRPGDERNHGTCRIEKALTPESACRAAFGRGLLSRWAYKDLGTRVGVVRSDKQRIAALTSTDGWHECKSELLSQMKEEQ